MNITISISLCWVWRGVSDTSGRLNKQESELGLCNIVEDIVEKQYPNATVNCRVTNCNTIDIRGISYTHNLNKAAQLYRHIKLLINKAWGDDWEVYDAIPSQP